MEGLNLISTFAEFKELKNIDRPTMMSVLEDIFRTQLAKMYGKEIILREKVDPAILGGMIVSCGDSMLAGSVKTRLDNMHKQIKDMIAG